MRVLERALKQSVWYGSRETAAQRLPHALDLGLVTLAEGVETERQWAFLTDERCDGVQGDLYARPMPEGALRQRLHAWALEASEVL